VRSVVLSAQQQVVMAAVGTAQQQPANMAQFSFANGVLTLDGVPLSQAIVELDRWYDADIRLGDSAVRNHILDATFAAGSFSDLSEVLTLALNVRVVRDGRILTLYTR
jgi:ferric-dicitrate binding protein FerR (iron transport regulator)